MSKHEENDAKMKADLQKEEERKSLSESETDSYAENSSIAESGAYSNSSKGSQGSNRRRHRRNIDSGKKRKAKDLAKMGVNTMEEATDAANKSASTLAGDGGDKPLKLRLDLNLDAEVTLKAKIHGDITLSLL